MHPLQLKRQTYPPSSKKNERTREFAAHRRAAIKRLAERESVIFYRETARFVDDRVLEVSDETPRPDCVVIATGSTVAVPALLGTEGIPVQTGIDALGATFFRDSGVVMAL
jgi:dihydrolipoamide dehydrogenase